MMPLETGPECVERPPPVVKDMAFNPSPAWSWQSNVDFRKFISSAWGVNGAKWFQGGAILVTASGSGSVRMWDPTQGKPSVQHFRSHTRCVNTVAVSPKDQFILTGDDNKKAVLYQNVREQEMSFV